MNRTEVKIEPKIQLEKHAKVLSLGSCFAENVGALLKQDGHDIVINPHGILFNPYSLYLSLNQALLGNPKPDHFGEFQEQFFHFDYHSRMNGQNREEVGKNIERANHWLVQRLDEADFLILTFGTAWVWRLLSTDEVIANCHKVPQNQFQKEILDLDFLTDLLCAFLGNLQSKRPNVKIVLTVSPVRHRRNGMHEDKVSKSILLLLCDRLEKQLEQVFYFPAYEIVIDELRDYSYFKNDLIHPTEEAVELVYERFKAFGGLV